MSKKIRNSNVAAAKPTSESNVAVLDQPINETEAGNTVAEGQTVTLEMPTESTEQAAAAPEVSDAPAKPAPFTVPTVKDVLGYGVGTETSYILDQLLAGKSTKSQIQQAFLAKF